MEGLTNLLGDKLRSLLALLGILIGTAAVIALMTSSQLATMYALKQFKVLGTHLLAVNLGSTQVSSKSSSVQLSMRDIEQIKTVSHGIKNIAPFSVLYHYVNYAGEKFPVQIIGADEHLAQIANIKTAQGRFVSSLDGINLYCFIGKKFAARLRAIGVSKPVGKQIRIGGRYFTIIGVAQPWPENLFIYFEVNDGIIIPLRTAYLLSHQVAIKDLLIKLDQHSDLKKIQLAVNDKINQLMPELQVTIRNPGQILKTLHKQRSTFSWLLVAIGGISLLVGGIGVMNVMLVSVMERKREIGVRLAIGARQHDILLMFLTESITLTFIGGALGVCVGLAISYGIACFSKWDFYFYPFPLILGFAVAVFVGLLSGFYPAWRAAHLDPITSLQSV